MKIKEYMLKNKISFRELAKKIGISHTYLNDIDKGAIMSEETYQKIKRVIPEFETQEIIKKTYKEEK